MKQIHLFIPVGLIAALAIAFSTLLWSDALAQGQNQKRIEPQKWEYKVVDTKPGKKLVEDDLNTLGDDGWEFAGSVDVLKGGRLTIILKRVKL